MVGWQLGGVDGWWRVEWEVREEKGIVSSNLSPLKERNHFFPIKSPVGGTAPAVEGKEGQGPSTQHPLHLEHFQMLN